MRNIIGGLLLTTSVLSCAPMAHAQGVASTLRELQLLVRPGETVTVTDAQGREVQGRIETLSPSLLALSDRSGRREWTETDIVSIRQRKGDSLANGALIGLAVGGGIGLIGGIAGTQDNENEKGWVPFLGALYGGIGAGIGVGIDAMIRDDYEIFRSTSAPPRTEVRLVPLLTPKRQGLPVSVSF